MDLLARSLARAHTHCTTLLHAGLTVALVTGSSWQLTGVVCACACACACACDAVVPAEATKTLLKHVQQGKPATLVQVEGSGFRVWIPGLDSRLGLGGWFIVFPVLMHARAHARAHTHNRTRTTGSECL